MLRYSQNVSAETEQLHDQNYQYELKALKIGFKESNIIGHKEACFLKNLHYHLMKSRHSLQGKKWVYNRVRDWLKFFPHLSLSTIERILHKLKTLGLIEIEHFHRDLTNRTNWYTINLPKFHEIFNEEPHTRTYRQRLTKSQSSEDPYSTPYRQSQTSEDADVITYRQNGRDGEEKGDFCTKNSGTGEAYSDSDSRDLHLKNRILEHTVKIDGIHKEYNNKYIYININNSDKDYKKRKKINKKRKKTEQESMMENSVSMASKTQTKSNESIIPVIPAPIKAEKKKEVSMKGGDDQQVVGRLSSCFSMTLLEAILPYNKYYDISEKSNCGIESNIYKLNYICPVLNVKNNTKQLQQNTKKSSISTKKTDQELLEQFNEWWMVYPNKKAKGGAERAYLKALKLTDQQTLLAATKRYIDYLEKHGYEKFAKHPATWLNQRCWEDVYKDKETKEETQTTPISEPVSIQVGDNSILLEALNELQNKRGEGYCKSWMRGITKIDLKDGVIHVQGKNRYATDMFRVRLEPDLINAAVPLLGSVYVDYSVTENPLPCAA